MANDLNRWLERATCGLSRDSAETVIREIREHYDAAAETVGAERALAVLGDPKEANRQYRKVLITASEARLLCESEWEAKAVCSRPVVKRFLPAAPAAAILAALVLLSTGGGVSARLLLLAGIALGFAFLAPFLPVYTAGRSRVVRYMKWAVLAGLPIVAFGGDYLNCFWVLLGTLWPLAWTEWKRAAIRRKIPIGQWPKHLYL